MADFRDLTDRGLRDCCAKIVEARSHFNQEPPNQNASEFLRLGLKAKEVVTNTCIKLKMDEDAAQELHKTWPMSRNARNF